MKMNLNICNKEKRGGIDSNFVNRNIRYRYRWIRIALSFVVIGLLIWYLAKHQSFCACFLRHFNLPEYLSIILPFVLAGSGAIVHWSDEKFSGGGIKYWVKEMDKSYILDPSVISATMTKQSVLAAISGVFIFGILNYIGTDKCFSFEYLAAYIAFIGFSTSILLLLVSVNTYDYANRFRWEKLAQTGKVDHQNYHKAKLVQKAFKLGIWAFYSLVLSFIISLAIISPYISILASIGCAWLLLYYYFFPIEKGNSYIVRQQYIAYQADKGNLYAQFSSEVQKVKSKIEDLKIEIENVFNCHQIAVVVEGKYTGILSNDKQATEEQFVHVWVFRNGKIEQFFKYSVAEWQKAKNMFCL